MAESTGAKTKVYVGTAVLSGVPDAAADFSTGTYTELSALITVGDYGDDVADVSYTRLRDGRTTHLKGIKDGGSIDLVLAYDADNSGQILLESTIYQSPSNLWPLKVAYENGDIHYMTFVLRTLKNSVGDGNSVRQLTATIGISSEVFKA